MSERLDCNGTGLTDCLSMYFTQSTHSPGMMLNGHATELEFPPSPDKHSLFSLTTNGFSENTDNNFCHKKNVTECIGFLNQELTSIGLPSLYDAGSDTHDISRLVNCAYDLLQKFQNSRRLREDLENRHHRQEADIAHLRETHRHLLRQLDQSQQETAQAQEKERQLTNKNKTLSNKLKAEREEVKRLQSVIQHRDAQYKHEVKKKEREQTKLKDRLHKLLSDKKGGKVGLDISAVVLRTDGKRGTWNSGNKQEEELYRQVISNYEERQKELMVENSGLRQCLNDIQTEVIAAFRAPSTGSRENSQLDMSQETKSKEDLEDSGEENKSGNPEDIKAGHFQMPIEYMENNLLRMVKDKCKQLRKHIKLIERQHSGGKSSEKKISPSKSEDRHKHIDMDKYKKEIRRYKDIIEEQETFIQSHLATQEIEASTSRFLNDSELLSDKENLDVQKKLFAEQKANFDKERNTYTEATIRLHKDKRTFEDEKVTYLRSQFLQMTPFQPRLYAGHPVGTSAQRQRSKPGFLPTTPAASRHVDNLQHVPLLTPRCAPNTPADQRGGCMMTPTTTDLYRHLGLTSQDENIDALGGQSRPKSADPLRSAHSSRSQTFTSPPWASSGRLRCSSAITKTSPPGETNKTHSSGSETQISDQMTDVKLMLFSPPTEADEDDEDH